MLIWLDKTEELLLELSCQHFGCIESLCWIRLIILGWLAVYYLLNVSPGGVGPATNSFLNMSFDPVDLHQRRNAKQNRMNMTPQQ
jgi:hypothetical protein